MLATLDNRVTSKSGVELEVRLFQLLRIQDGMIVFGALYLDREQAVKAAGLEQ